MEARRKLPRDQDALLVDVRLALIHQACDRHTMRPPNFSSIITQGQSSKFFIYEIDIDFIIPGTAPPPCLPVRNRNSYWGLNYRGFRYYEVY
eukprot:2031425-Pyramimonas_sp.AAC.1